jgi:hypothetical protein
MEHSTEKMPLTVGDIDLKKLEIEYQKLALEERKVNIEDRKAKYTVWSIVVTACVAAGAIVFNVISARNAMRAQFQLQAARYMMESQGPVEAWAMSQTFSKMFPEYLPEGFGTRYNPETDFMNYGPGLRESKRELFQVLASRCKSQKEIITLYAQLNPTDAEWINETFKMNLPVPQSTEEQYP